MQDIIQEIKTQLIANIDEVSLRTSEKYFKEPIDYYGVRMPVVHQIAKKAYKQLKENSKADVWDLCDVLWGSGILEESIVACDWSYALHKQYTADDFIRFEKWIKQDINNWASCDTFCNHTVGAFVMLYPDYLDKLKDFTQSPKRWARRAAAVSLIVPARKGLFLSDIFEIADLLLTDKDDLVQKGYGWMLKVASQQYERQVFDYVMSHKAVMPRTALRYAIEKMPRDSRQMAMTK